MGQLKDRLRRLKESAELTRSWIVNNPKEFVGMVGDSARSDIENVSAQVQKAQESVSTQVQKTREAVNEKVIDPTKETLQRAKETTELTANWIKDNPGEFVRGMGLVGDIGLKKAGEKIGEKFADTMPETNRKLVGLLPDDNNHAFSILNETVAVSINNPKEAVATLVDHAFPAKREISPNLPDNLGKNTDDILVAFFRPTNSGPTGHVALLYKGNTIDLYPEEIASTETRPGIGVALKVALSKGNVRQGDRTDGKLQEHKNLEDRDVQVIAIRPEMLKRYYISELHYSEEKAQEMINGLDERMSNIRNRKDGWSNWNTMGSEKSGNCADGVRYFLGIPREYSTFLGEKEGLALPSALEHHVTGMMVDKGYAYVVPKDVLTPKNEKETKVNNQLLLASLNRDGSR